MSFSVSSECHQPKDFIGPKVLLVQIFHWSKDFIGVFLNLSECLSQCLLSVISPKISLVQRFHWSKDFIGVFLNLSECLSQCLLSVISPKISLVQRFHWSKYFIGPKTLLVSF